MWERRHKHTNAEYLRRKVETLGDFLLLDLKHHDKSVVTERVNTTAL